MAKKGDLSVQVITPGTISTLQMGIMQIKSSHANKIRPTLSGYSIADNGCFS